jgi:hypothetical protein
MLVRRRRPRVDLVASKGEVVGWIDGEGFQLWVGGDLRDETVGPGTSVESKSISLPTQWHRGPMGVRATETGRVAGREPGRRESDPTAGSGVVRDPCSPIRLRRIGVGSRCPTATETCRGRGSARHRVCTNLSGPTTSFSVGSTRCSSSPPRPSGSAETKIRCRHPWGYLEATGLELRQWMQQPRRTTWRRRTSAASPLSSLAGCRMRAYAG